MMSEWLIIESLMQGFRLTGTAAGLATAVAGALLALTSGIAIVAFVKVFAISFLGINRGAPPLRRTLGPLAAGIPMAAACLGLGVGAPWLTALLGRVGETGAGANVAGNIANPGLLMEPAFAAFSSVSPTELAIVLPIAALIPLLVVLASHNRSAGHRRTPVWNSGATPFGHVTQYTALGFSNPLRIVFGKLLLPQRLATADTPVVVSASYASESRLLAEEFVYEPLVRLALWLNRHVRRLQSGALSLYLLYMLIGLIVVLLVVPLS